MWWWPSAAAARIGWQSPLGGHTNAPRSATQRACVVCAVLRACVAVAADGVVAFPPPGRRTRLGVGCRPRAGHGVIADRAVAVGHIVPPRGSSRCNRVGVSKGWREAAPVSMAMAIGGSRRRTLAPRHQAVGLEAGTRRTVTGLGSASSPRRHRLARMSALPRDRTRAPVCYTCTRTGRGWLRDGRPLQE